MEKKMAPKKKKTKTKKIKRFHLPPPPLFASSFKSISPAITRTRRNT